VSRDLVIRPQAEAELAEAGDWYDRERPGLGPVFVLAVSRTLAAVQQNPLQYQIVWRQYRRARVAKFPYSLIYRVSDRDITVVSCFHGRRNPTVWQRRS
jgi:plasmid stabilization system protein ParE